HRTRVFFIGTAAPVVPEFVLVTDPGQVQAQSDPVQYAESLHPGTAYVLVSTEAGYTLTRRVS
ncbi:MAG: hypothetical protein ABI899_06520, partial [Actinomycetota bacterium]